MGKVALKVPGGLAYVDPAHVVAIMGHDGRSSLSLPFGADIDVDEPADVVAARLGGFAPGEGGSFYNEGQVVAILPGANDRCVLLLNGGFQVYLRRSVAEVAGSGSHDPALSNQTAAA